MPLASGIHPSRWLLLPPPHPLAVLGLESSWGDTVVHPWAEGAPDLVAWAADAGVLPGYKVFICSANVLMCRRPLFPNPVINTL